jgi:hypothetical protein
MKQLQASRLIIRNLPYEVRVWQHQESSILVHLDEAIGQRVLIERLGSTAFVRGQRQHNQSATAAPGSALPPLFDGACIEISVPRDMPLALSGVRRATIEALDGPLHIVAPPDTDSIAIARMQGGSIVASGGHVEVGEGDGEALSLLSMGKGAITVHGGRTQHLTGVVVGDGSIVFAGEADIATLVMRGSGSLAVAHVSVPLCTRLGRGTIRMGRHAL